MIYTKSNAARVLTIQLGFEVKPAHVQSMVEVGSKFNVTYRKDRQNHTALVTKAELKLAFVEYRKSEAADLISAPLPGGSGYAVINTEKDSCNFVTVTDSAVECTCEDYNNQQEFFKDKPKACKHGYHVLMSRLQVNSLSEWIQLNQVTDEEVAA